MAAGQGQMAANGRATRTRLKMYRHAISHMHVPSSRPLADAARTQCRRLGRWTVPPPSCLLATQCCSWDSGTLMED